MTEIEYLCSVHVRGDRDEKLHVWATPELLVIDRIGRKDDERERVRTIELTHIKSIEVDAIRDERHQYGWKPTTGFLNSGKVVEAVTGVLVALDDGEHLLWRVPYKAPIEVRAEFGRLVHAVRTKS